MFLLLICVLTSSSFRVSNGSIESKYFRVDKHAMSKRKAIMIDKVSLSSANEEEKAYINEERLSEMYAQLKANCFPLLMENASLGDESNPLHTAKNVIDTIEGNLEALFKGFDDTMCKMYEDELIELAAIICLNKLNRYDRMFAAIDRVFDFSVSTQHCLYDKILDHFNDKKQKIDVSDIESLSEIEKFIAYVLCLEIQSLIQTCHTNTKYLKYFIKYPMLVKKSIKRILDGGVHTGKECKFIFYNLLFCFVNDNSSSYFLSQESYMTYEKEISHFINGLFGIYQSFAKRKDCYDARNVMIKYSFPILRSNSICNYGLKRILKSYKNQPELYHLLMLPFTFSSCDQKKATLTKIVSKETARKLEKITENLPFRRLGFFLVSTDTLDPKILDPCTLDALGLQYNADFLECDISYSMMVMPVKYPVFNLVVDQIFIVTTWLSMVLDTKEKNLSFNFYLPNNDRCFDVREFIPSTGYYIGVDMFFRRCGMFKYLNPNYAVFERVKGKNRSFEEFAGYILETYFTFEEQQIILRKYEILKERESMSSDDQILTYDLETSKVALEKCASSDKASAIYVIDEDSEELSK